MGIDPPGIGRNSRFPHEHGKGISIHRTLYVPRHLSASYRLFAPDIEGPEEAHQRT